MRVSSEKKMGSLFTKDIAVLDVNSRLVTAIVGSKRAQSVFGIKAMAEKQHQGYENGEWFDKDETVEFAKSVLVEAMKEAESRTKRLFVGVPAEFVVVITKEVSIRLDRRRRVVDDDIAYLLKKGDDFDSNKYVTINTSAIYYSLDDQDKIYNDVRDMEAVKVDACVSYMLCEKSFIDMFDKVASLLGFTDVKYVATCWAECMALLEKEQRDNVYMLIDVGYLSSSVCIAKGEGILDMKSFSMGGAHICADIFEALDVPFDMAEEAKRLVDLNLNYSDEAVLVSDGDNVVYAADACEVAKNRLDVFVEVLAGIFKEIEDDAPSYMPVYITGEGIASMRGATKYLSEQLGKNMEIITPKLPGFVKPEDCSKASLLVMADNLSRFDFGAFIKKLFNGGKK